MGRTRGNIDQLRVQAVALRRAGKSLRQIKEALGPLSNATLTEWLRGVPPPEWTRRPNAKDDLRTRARELREQGLRYKDIAARLHVSMSSVSLWVRDLPTPPRLLPEESKKRSKEGFYRYWEKESKARAVRRSSDIAAAAAEIGNLTDRELLIAGAIAYWCEGTKRRPPRYAERVVFINSDPALISLFLRFLKAAGVDHEDLILRLYIHETADAEASQRFWLDVTGAASDQFRRAVLKHHKPKTLRKNTGDGYHGCLRIDVRRSSELYRKIEGWASAAMSTSLADPTCP